MEKFPASLLAAREFVLDLLFPVRCFACGSDGSALCAACLRSVPLPDRQRCPACRKESPSGKTCPDCRADTPLDGLFAAAPYRHLVLKHALHLYKYQFVESVREPLGTLLSARISLSDIPLPEVLVPVPLHPRRLRWRDFNQSEELARAMARNAVPYASLPVVVDHLKRVRNTKPQMGLADARERGRNVRNAFAWRPPIGSPVRIDGKRLWLIDDVATTTATLSECASALKQGGAAEVYAVVLAR
jgi:ComF family protein